MVPWAKRKRENMVWALRGAGRERADTVSNHFDIVNMGTFQALHNYSSALCCCCAVSMALVLVASATATTAASAIEALSAAGVAVRAFV